MVEVSRPKVLGREKVRRYRAPPLSREAERTRSHSIGRERKCDCQASLPPDLSGLKVLIVDDEPGSLEAFAEIVKSFGGEPIQCSSVHDAMKVLEKAPT